MSSKKDVATAANRKIKTELLNKDPLRIPKVIFEALRINRYKHHLSPYPYLLKSNCFTFGTVGVFCSHQQNPVRFQKLSSDSGAWILIYIIYILSNKVGAGGKKLCLFEFIGSYWQGYTSIPTGMQGIPTGKKTIRISGVNKTKESRSLRMQI